jgi:hypothetical protein
MNRLLFFAAVVAVSLSASAQPVITSVTPNHAPVAGGTHVTITGSAFENCFICDPPYDISVMFGSVYAPRVTIVNSTTLDVVTPPHMPGTFDVNVRQFNGTAQLPDAFTFEGSVTDAFEPILVPLAGPPVHGAFGSEFHNELRVGNKHDVEPLTLYGVDTSCSIADPPNFPQFAFYLPGGAAMRIFNDCGGWPARLMYVPKAQSAQVTFNERVRDVSRTDQSHGTEIPVVRASQMTSGRITLLDVPLDDSRFRNTLRIYSTASYDVPVTVTINNTTQTVVLHAGANIFEPAYGVFTNFPKLATPAPNDSTVSVTIDPPPPPVGGGAPVPPPPLIWALLTVTNNATQQITTITAR